MVAEEMNDKVEAKARRGLLVMLCLSFAAAMLGYAYALYHVSVGASHAEQFGMELSALAQLFIRLGVWGFVPPLLVFGLALGVTGAGRSRRGIGVMLAALLFAFSVLWPAGAVLAFLDAYDPPRSSPSYNQPGPS